MLWSVGDSPEPEFGELDSNPFCATNLWCDLVQGTFLCLNFLLSKGTLFHDKEDKTLWVGDGNSKNKAGD